MKRYIEENILRDLSKKMVFVGGPRQVGKTTMAKRIMQDFIYEKSKKGLYLNWDFDDDKEIIIGKKWDDSHQLIIFDEIHKYHRWKNWIKGIYDKQNHIHRFLITGSARLDFYRRGGDSLMGRYHYWRLHPITLDELPEKMSLAMGMKRLMRIGGFPEPFLDGNEQSARRWRRERFDRIIKEDIRDLEPIKLISSVGLFVNALRKRVGRLIILSNIAKEIQISPKTAKLWLEVINRMYLCFSIRPYSRNLPRSLQRPPKVYFFDNADLILDRDEGPCFENLVATHLLKKIHYLEDVSGQNVELGYIRDKEFREVDFIILKDDVIFALIEVKLSDDKISKSLQYYSERLHPKHSMQIVMNLKQEYKKGKCRVLKLETALQVLFDK
ncbi:MAG: AAA family ATPase [Halobacteriovoraceae bacterium]|nr:AAA family ATPase [Halobacteriovoraceae bacterium]